MVIVSDLLTVDEYCSLVHKKRQTAAKDRMTGRCPKYVKIGGRILYKRQSVEEYLASCERTSTSDSGHPCGACKCAAAAQ